MRGLQGHYVERFVLLSRFPDVRDPLADAHLHNAMSGQENRRHRPELTGRGVVWWLQLPTIQTARLWPHLAVARGADCTATLPKRPTSVRALRILWSA